VSLTLVVALFDLARRNEVTRRSMDWLIEHGQRVLALDYPMVVYTEKHLLGRLAHERAVRGLYQKTQFVITEFEELPHYPVWKGQEASLSLVKNRNPVSDHLDNFLINWEKPGLIAGVAVANPFGTSHTAWINLGIQNVQAFDSVGWEDAFDPPDVVRIHQQRYLNKAIVSDPEFYQYGRCVTAGGFLAGTAESLAEFADDFYEELNRVLGMGLAPNDEDVIGTMLVEHPEKYVVSYGDYGQIFCNAKRPRWGGGSLQWVYNRSLYWMIGAAMACGDLPWAARLWHLIMQSARDGYFTDDTAVLEQFRPVLEPLGG